MKRRWIKIGNKNKLILSVWVIEIRGPNIRLRILFSNTLTLHSSLNARDHVSQPYSTTGNIIVLYTYFNFLILREKSRKQKCLDWTITRIFCFKSTFHFLVNKILFVNKESKYLKVFAFPYEWHPISMYLVFLRLTTVYHKSKSCFNRRQHSIFPPVCISFKGTVQPSFSFNYISVTDATPYKRRGTTLNLGHLGCNVRQFPRFEYIPWTCLLITFSLLSPWRQLPALSLLFLSLLISIRLVPLSYWLHYLGTMSWNEILFIPRYKVPTYIPTTLV